MSPEASPATIITVSLVASLLFNTVTHSFPVFQAHAKSRSRPRLSQGSANP
jgi:hypothetical protein